MSEWSWRWSFVLCSELSDEETAGRDGETEDGRNNTKVAQWRKYQAAVARKKERDRNRKVSSMTKDGWSEMEERAEW